MKHPGLTEKQIATIKSMSLYWSELQTRENNKLAFNFEMLQLQESVLTSEELLSILSLYVNSLP